MKPKRRVRQEKFLKNVIWAWVRITLGYLLVFQQALVPVKSLVQSAQAASNGSVGVSFTVNDGPPANINDLVAISGGNGNGSLTLTWTEPGANGTLGQAALYLVHYSTAANINNDTDFTNNSTTFTARTIVPGQSGSIRTEVITGLCPGFTYYWAIKAQNGQGKQGSWIHDSSHNPNNSATPSNGIPAAVQNLTALTGEKVVTLSWTSTNMCDFVRYRIHKDTQSPPNTILVDLTDQSTASFADTNVTNGTTYYYTVEVFNSFSSSTTAVLAAVPNPTTLPNKPVILSTASFAVSTSQIQYAWSESTPPSVQGFRLKNFSGGSVLTSDLSPGTTATILANLSPNQSVNAIVEAFNAAGVKDSDPLQKTTLANPPANSSIGTVTSSSIGLSWSSNSNQGTPTYEIVYGTDSGFNSASSTTTTSTSFTLTGLQPNTLYYLHARSINNEGIKTAFDVTLSTMTTGTGVGVPAAPVVKGASVLSVDSTNQNTQVQLSWNPVGTDNNGAAIASPSYLVNVSASLPTAGQWSGTSTTSGTSYAVTLPNSTTRYVAVRAQNSNGQSQLGTIFRWPDQKWITPTTDVTSWVEMTKDANAALSSSGQAGYIAYLTQQSDLTPGVVKSVQVSILDPTTGKTVSNMNIPAGGGRIVVGYTVQGSQVVQATPAMMQGAPVVDASKAAQQLALFLYIGVTWIKLGGDVDTTNNQVAFNTSRIGQFQIRQTLRLGDLTLVQVYPRIITPNGDGKNDVAIFQFGEGSLAGVDIKGEVFDITGAKVADLKPGPDPNTTLMWDGKDGSGVTVLSGIYIYQIELGGNRVNGTVVVAR